MIALDFTPDELSSGQMSQVHLETAVHALKTDGYVVLNDVIDRAHLESLRERMLDDLQKILARDDTPFNFNAINVQQDPPPFHPYLFRDVLLNDLVIAVTQAVLGAGLKNGYYSGNTALPGDQMQPVHADMGQLWPNLEQATPPYSLVVNVPLVDMSAQNGSTELWPGTHLDTTIYVQRGDIKLSDELVEKQRQIRPPLQPCVRAGSVLIRDTRMWHRGMPNYTNDPRPMIAMVHYISWWHDQKPIPFAKGSEDFFEHPILKTNARFVDEVDYIHHNKAYDFQREMK